jgi:hypothetical protein
MENLRVIMTPRLLPVLTLLFFASCLQDSQANFPARNRRNASAAAERTLASADFQRGVNHAHIHRRGHGYGSAKSAAELDSLKDIGINWIAIMPYGYQEGATGDKVFGYPTNEGRTEFFTHTDPTLTDEDVVAEVASAHARGFGVTIKPQIWSYDFWRGGEWHGTIRQNSPEAHARWWETYKDFALHYAHIAEESHAEQYCIGTELVRMTTEHSDEWRLLIGEIRKVFHGQLMYAAHWDSEFEKITFWDALDYIGISAYFPLDAPDSASVETLVDAWKSPRQRIQAVVRRFRRPVLFMEAGYRSMVGTFRKPWEEKGRLPDDDAQARAYEALFRAFANARWWKGVYFCKTFTDPALSYERDDGTSFSFRGKPAQAVVEKWFGGSRMQ